MARLGGELWLRRRGWPNLWPGSQFGRESGAGNLTCPAGPPSRRKLSLPKLHKLGRWLGSLLFIQIGTTHFFRTQLSRMLSRSIRASPSLVRSPLIARSAPTLLRPASTFALSSAQSARSNQHNNPQASTSASVGSLRMAHGMGESAVSSLWSCGVDVGN